MAHPKPRLRIPAQQREYLQRFIDLSKESVESLQNALDTAKPAISAEALANQIIERVDLDYEIVVGIVEMLLSLSSAREHFQLSLETVVTGLTESALRDEIGLPKTSVDNFKDRLRSLLAVNGTIAISSRAINVILENEHTFVSARIMSDIRPIFSQDESPRSVAAAIIHNLKIESHTNDGHTKHYFALDSRDLKVLRAVIDRAVRKEQVLKETIRDSSISYLEIGEAEAD